MAYDGRASREEVARDLDIAGAREEGEAMVEEGGCASLGGDDGLDAGKGTMPADGFEGGDVGGLLASKA
jgi:hypothetical protein